MTVAVTAILLAGARPIPDPLAVAAGVAVKPLVPVGGEPMINRPARALLDHPAIGDVIILTQRPDLFAADPATAWLAEHPRVRFEQGGQGIAASLLDLMARGVANYPLLLTTADHVLLDRAMLDQFVAEAQGADIAVAMVERATLLARYPGSRRTWLKFRDGWWSGANIFWFGSDKKERLLRQLAPDIDLKTNAYNTEAIFKADKNYRADIVETELHWITPELVEAYRYAGIELMLFAV